jgi:hypothetical protein
MARRNKGPVCLQSSDGKILGAGCGNLRTTNEFKFREVHFSSVNGYELPGWLIGTAENGKGRAKGAIMLIPLVAATEEKKRDSFNSSSVKTSTFSR